MQEDPNSRCLPLYTVGKCRKAVRCLAILLWLLAPKFATAQDFFFSTLSVREGLPSHIVTGITQDKYGFLWISTDFGLARYDGKEFMIFSKGITENTLSSNVLTGVLTTDHHVWVGSWDGLCKVDIKTFEITRVDIGSNRAIRTLHLSHDSTLWVGTAMGLIKLDIDSENYELYSKENSGLSHNTVRSIYLDKNDRLWVGTFDGLNCLDKNHERFEPVPIAGNLTSRLENRLIMDIKSTQRDTDSLLWVGTETGLVLLNTNTRSSKDFVTKSNYTNQVIKHIFVESEDKVWLGTEFGLNRFNPKRSTNEKIYHNPQVPYSISNNVIWQVFEDQGGVLWFATSNGLSRIHKSGSFYRYHKTFLENDGNLIGNQIRSFFSSSGNTLWMASQYGAVCIDQSTGVSKTFNYDPANAESLLLNSTYAIEEDSLGRIWIGGAGGINIWDPKQRTMKSITPTDANGLKAPYIGKFTQTDKGTLWVSAWDGGLYRVSGDIGDTRKITFDAVPGLLKGSELHCYGAGYIWTIEYDKLYRVDPKTLEIHHIKSFEKTTGEQTIYSMYMSSNGVIWAGTLNGMVEFDPESETTHIHKTQSSENSITASITEDQSGNIWGVTNTSLQKLNVSSGELEVFPLNEELPLKSFFYGCALTLDNGDILFGGNNGYIRFDPEQATQYHLDPPIYITQLEVNNQSILAGQEISGTVLLGQDIAFSGQLTLGYKENTLTFTFSSLDYLQPNLNSYSYTLEGYDSDWKLAGNNRQTTYTQIPPGKYTFKVRSSNHMGHWSEKYASLNIYIIPPFWQTLWFRVTMIFAVIFSALGYYKMRVSALNRQKKELEIKVLERTQTIQSLNDELRSSNAELTELNALLQEQKSELETAIDELKNARERLAVSEKMASLGIMSAGIAHEINNPINFISGATQKIFDIIKLKKNKALLEDNEQKEVLDKMREIIQTGVKRTTNIVQTLKNYTRTENRSIEFDVIEALDEALLILSHQLGSEITIVRDHPDTLPVNCEPRTISQIFMDLIRNSIEALDGKGTINVVIKKVSKGKNNKVQITISDNGKGMTQEQIGKIFDPFYTTKSVGEGTGLGLYMVYGLVNQIKGTINVESQPGKGTSFAISFPVE